MNRDPENDLPILYKHAQRMLITAERTIEKGFSYSETDHYGFMLISFLMKQIDHMRSVCVLVKAGQYSDATAIARIMLEGLCTLIWSSHKPEERPLQWKAYVLVTDWNSLQKKKKSGESIDREQEERLKANLHKYGERYFTKKSRKDGAENYEHPYQKTWLLDQNGAHVRRGVIFSEVRGSELYELYEEFSQWIHWTPSGICESIVQNETGVMYNPNAYPRAAQSLAVSIQAILQTLELVFIHFKKASKPSLEELRDEYLNDIGINI